MMKREACKSRWKTTPFFLEFGAHRALNGDSIANRNEKSEYGTVRNKLTSRGTLLDKLRLGQRLRSKGEKGVEKNFQWDK